MRTSCADIPFLTTNLFYPITNLSSAMSRNLIFTLFLAFMTALSAAAQSTPEEVSAALNGGGVLTFGSNRNTAYTMSETTAHKVVCTKTKSGDETRMWVVRSKGLGSYTLRNVATGYYLQTVSGASTQYTTSKSPSTFYIGKSPQSTDSKLLHAISTSMSFDGYTCLHDDSEHKVVNWAGPKENGSNGASSWRLNVVDEVDFDAVRARFFELDGYVDPVAGKIVRICNNVTGLFMTERSEDNSLYTTWSDDENMAQHWRVLQNTNGELLLQNVKTLRYIGKSGNYGSFYTTSDPVTVDLTMTESRWDRTYAISSGGTYCYNSGGNNVISGARTDARSQWNFLFSELSEEDIAGAQGDYQLFTDLTVNRTTYNAAFCPMFTDASCSELRDEYRNMSDDELVSKMTEAGLSQHLQNIALKVKRSAWAPYEEQFRVADYSPYSRYDAWNAVGNPEMIGTSYWFGRLSNPTGIVAHAGDVLTIFCQNDAPQGTTLQLETVQGTGQSGKTATLHEGLNVFTFSSDVICYIFYQVHSTSAALADFPPVRVHFEGGAVQGYFDLTRGHTNDDWQYISQNMLKESSVVNLKTKHLVFAFDAALTKKACPKEMEGVLGIWEDIITLEREILGVNNKYIPNVEERFNNIFNCFSGDSNLVSYMHATNYGGYFHETTISTIMNYAQMQADGIWGPAHELGHLHQALYNLIGTTEASNNLYSNAYVLHQGRTTERAAAPKTVFNEFAAGTHWVDQDIWTMTKLYYQLYVYYQILGNCPDFFPRLFVRLREDGLDRRQNTPVNGRDEYLKFARLCCDISGDDLTELFEAYGFFRPCEDRYIRDYGDYYLSTTQADIDATLEYMKKFPHPAGNILFLDDRIEPVLATYEGHAEGEMKKRRSDDQVGAGVSAGDYGQYTTFIAPATAADYEASAPDYYYTMTTAGSVTIHGTGAKGLVGIKVYDEAGRLVYLANTHSFNVGKTLAAQPLIVKAAMGDGTDILLGRDAPLPEGIHTTTATTSMPDYYRLDGRRTTRPTHGISISDGRKTIRR